MNPRRRPLVLLVVVVALVAAALLVLPDPRTVVVEESVGAESALPAGSGVWYCPPATVDADRAAIVQAAPPGGGRPSNVVARAFRGIDDQANTPTQLFPGAGSSQQLEQPSTPVEVRWDDQPMVASRLTTVTDEPAGVVAGPCAPTVSTSWYVAGVTTAAGATAELEVANPFSTEAAVAVTFLTPAGPEEPLAVQNVPVPAGGTTTIDIGEVMPQREDLGVRVTARSGRVAVQGVQQSVPTINGVLGRSWVGATDRAATTWHLPWVATAGDGTAGFDADEGTDDGDDGTDDGDDGSDGGDETAEPTEAPTDPDDIEVVVEGEAEPSSWLWIANPSDEAAQLNLSLLTPTGRVVPDLVTPLRADAQSVLRIDLEPYLSDLSGDVGAQVVSTNDVPVVAGAGAIVATGDDVERTGIATQVGQRSADTNWSLTGPSGPDRRQLLTIGNPMEETATVSVSAWTGATSVRPADLQGLVLAPGQLQTVDLGALGLSGSSFTAFVGVTEGQVTASLRSATDQGPLALATPPGVPSRIWVASGIATAVRRQEGMVNRFGTTLGLEAPTPGASPSPGPDGGGFGDEGQVDDPDDGAGVDGSTTTPVPSAPASGPATSPAPSTSPDDATTPSPAETPTDTPTGTSTGTADETSSEDG